MIPRGVLRFPVIQWGKTVFLRQTDTLTEKVQKRYSGRHDKYNTRCLAGVIKVLLIFGSVFRFMSAQFLNTCERIETSQDIKFYSFHTKRCQK
jgi:hypothetical protein